MDKKIVILLKAVNSTNVPKITKLNQDAKLIQDKNVLNSSI